LDVTLLAERPPAHSNVVRWTSYDIMSVAVCVNEG
jgi:hypothetical protein